MSDINDRIAKAKGWRWEEHHPYVFGSETYATWLSPGGYAAEPPDFTGTLEGVAGMMRELQDEENATSHDWLLRWSTFLQVWDFWKEDEHSHERLAEFLSTKEQGFGVAIGEAWISVFGEEAANGV